jgi:RNA polymerase sigma factor (TIGR02999 family)
VSTHSSHDVTQLLRAWGRGEAGALERLACLLYDDLHRLARRYMAGEQPGRTLQPTALLNEAYLRLIDSPENSFKDRAYFFGACAQMMRRILVDSARHRQAMKRGADVRPLELEDALVSSQESGPDLVALDDALHALAALDPRRAKVVELRFFGGMSVQETAEALDVSSETVMRDWKLAKSWLRSELTGGHANDS